MKMFNVASLGLDIDAHPYVTAATFRSGYSLMALLWHDSCSTTMFHADVQGAAPRGRPKQPTWGSVMLQVITSSMCRRL